jgi:hypothetical protein
MSNTISADRIELVITCENESERKVTLAQAIDYWYSEKYDTKVAMVKVYVALPVLLTETTLGEVFG